MSVPAITSFVSDYISFPKPTEKTSCIGAIKPTAEDFTQFVKSKLPPSISERIPSENKTWCKTPPVTFSLSNVINAIFPNKFPPVGE